MTRRLPGQVWAIALLVAGGLGAGSQRAPAPRRNVLIFVADGLRHDAVDARNTPTLWAIRNAGVHFTDSHAVFPTVTTVNASVIATGHGIGDTGDYGNTIWTGFPMFDTGNFDLLPATPVPFLEDDRTLADLDDHFGGNYLGSDTFLALARAHGYRTASVGKAGPAAIQDAAAISPAFGAFPATLPGIVVDDATGNGAGVPWPAGFELRMLADGVSPAAPGRNNGYGPTSSFNNGYSGDFSKAGTLAANVVQQDWFVEIATRYVLPWLTQDAGAPFAFVFWSRDPDATLHYQGDSLGTFFPGINGPTSQRAARNADRCLERLLGWLDANPGIKANTDIIVTSDHGFATISRSKIDRAGHLTASEAAKHDYVNAAGQIDTQKGTLPSGFLALDLAYDLRLSVFDPDAHAPGSRLYRKLRIGLAGDAVPVETWEHPAQGNALVGANVRRLDGRDASFVVAANGGADLIYLPDERAEILHQVVDRLLTYDYVGGVFVDDKFGDVPGTLPLSAVNLAGASKLRRPAIVVAFKVFYLNPSNLLTAVQISDTGLQEGQGMHGGIGRDSTFNNMAAAGPDFKPQFADAAPAGNADITPTLAHLLGFEAATGGPLVGRVLYEAIAGGPSAEAPPVRYRRSAPANGRQAILLYHEYGGARYLHAGCFVPSGTTDTDACR